MINTGKFFEYARIVFLAILCLIPVPAALVRYFLPAGGLLHPGVHPHLPHQIPPPIPDLMPSTPLPGGTFPPHGDAQNILLLFITVISVIIIQIILLSMLQRRRRRLKLNSFSFDSTLFTVCCLLLSGIMLFSAKDNISIGVSFAAVLISAAYYILEMFFVVFSSRIRIWSWRGLVFTILIMFHSGMHTPEADVLAILVSILPFRNNPGIIAPVLASCISSAGMLLYQTSGGYIFSGWPILVILTFQGIIGGGWFLSKSMRQTDETERASRLYDGIMNVASDLISILTADGRVISVNHAISAMFGYSRDDVIGKMVFDIYPVSEKFKEIFFDFINGIEPSYSYDAELPTVHEGNRYFLIRMHKIVSRFGKVCELIIVLTDITERKQTELQLLQANENLQRLADHDALTNLPNRRFFDETMRREWHRAQRNSLCLSIVMIDIDYFKKYNDSRGHLEGDKVLRTAADIFRRQLRRAADLCARFGGEEFALILPETDSLEAEQVVRRIFDALNSAAIPHPSSKIGNNITISAGIASVIPVRGAVVPEDIIARADAALYLAKQEGRSKYKVYKEEETFGT